MTVVCSIKECYYCSKNGFCQNPIVFITPNGFCGRIYDKRGGIKENWNAPPEEKKQEQLERTD